MFGFLTDIVGSMGRREAEPTPEPPHIDIASYVEAMKRSADETAHLIHRMEEARRAPVLRPKLFKLAASCPHCHSNDYLKHHDRVQCAYCRIPMATQPPHPTLGRRPMPDNEYQRWLLAQQLRGLSNAAPSPYLRDYFRG
jgi:hypothetical protein